MARAVRVAAEMPAAEREVMAAREVRVAESEVTEVLTVAEAEYTGAERTPSKWFRKTQPRL